MWGLVLRIASNYAADSRVVYVRRGAIGWPPVGPSRRTTSGTGAADSSCISMALVRAMNWPWLSRSRGMMVLSMPVTMLSACASQWMMGPPPTSTCDGKARLASRASTENVQAYELMARARHAYLQVTREHVSHGVKLLRQAIELDPNYAEASAHLAIAHFVLPYFSTVSPSSIEASAREAIDRAFELDDGLLRSRRPHRGRSRRGRRGAPRATRR